MEILLFTWNKNSWQFIEIQILIIKSNTTSTTCGVISAENLSYPLVFSGVHAAWSLVFCELFCRSLILLASVFCVILQFMVSDYPLVSSDVSYTFMKLMVNNSNDINKMNDLLSLYVNPNRVGREIPVAGIPSGNYREIPSWEIL